MTFERRCPNCNRVIIHTKQKARDVAALKGTLCKSCTMKRERVNNAIAWLNEDSVKKKSESLKVAHAKPDASWNTPEWRENQSRVATQQAIDGTHPFQNFSREKIMEMARRSRETNLTSGSNFQQHVAWRNTPEGHTWLSAIAKKFRAENPVFHTAEYDQKNRVHLTRARKLVRKFPTSKPERELSEALHNVDENFILNTQRMNIGPYQPDIVNYTRHTVVEFYGDYSHSNPNIYAADSWNALSHKYAHDVWTFDAKRQAFIESQGWRVIIVWEREWKTSREDTIQRIVRLDT